MTLNIAQTPASPNNYMVGRTYNGLSYKPEMIILHWIDGDLSAADSQFISNTQSRVSAHYGIGDDVVHQYVGETDTAYHAGNWLINLKSIGIEHKGSPTLPISESTMQTSINLVFDICKWWGIPADSDHIKRHRDIIATQCPGTLDVERIIREVALLLNPPPPVVVNIETRKANELDAIGTYLGFTEDDINKEGFGDVAIGKIRLLVSSVTPEVIGTQPQTVTSEGGTPVSPPEQAKVNLFVSLFKAIFARGGGNT